MSDTATTPQVKSDPLDRLLQAAVERTDDSAVKRWLQALLTGERAVGRDASERGPTPESNLLRD